MSPLLVFIGRGSPNTQTILVVSGKCVLTVWLVGVVETIFRAVFGENRRLPARADPLETEARLSLTGRPSL